MSKQAFRRQRWLAAFETKVLELNPAMAGKINWDAAIFYWNSGGYAADSAVKYVENNS